MSALDELRRGIPTFTCKPGCHACCGPVPCTAEELQRMGPPPAEGIPGLCVYATEQGCACYDERPLMCRLFGVVDCEQLRCPHGRPPLVSLSHAQAGALIESYYSIENIEFTAIRKWAST